MIISSNRLRGYSVEAADGRATTLDGLLFDDRNWTIRHLVVRTSRWRDRRKLLVVPSVVSAIAPRERLLNVRLTVEELERAPGIGPSLHFVSGGPHSLNMRLLIINRMRAHARPSGAPIKARWRRTNRWSRKSQSCSARTRG